MVPPPPPVRQASAVVPVGPNLAPYAFEAPIAEDPEAPLAGREAVVAPGHRDTGQQGQQDVGPIPESERRGLAEQQVASRTPADGGHHGQDQEAEQVQATAAGLQSPRDGERERTEVVESLQDCRTHGLRTAGSGGALEVGVLGGQLLDAAPGEGHRDHQVLPRTIGAHDHAPAELRVDHLHPGSEVLR